MLQRDEQHHLILPLTKLDNGLHLISAETIRDLEDVLERATMLPSPHCGYIVRVVETEPASSPKIDQEEPLLLPLERLFDILHLITVQTILDLGAASRTTPRESGYLVRVVEVD